MEVRTNTPSTPVAATTGSATAPAVAAGTKAPLGFGRVFTEHMVRMDYEPATGWGEAQVQLYAPITIDPAASSLHYGQTAFEGLKAFIGVDGELRMFRAEAHAERFARSCEQLCIPPIDPEVFLDAVRMAVSRDRSWVPTDEGSALYIRPFVFASEAFLGVRPAVRYTFLVILSPVGAYYAKGFGPVRIWVEREAVRAAPGGLGGAKTAANYAASMRAAAIAKERGYDQVLWTDAHEHRYLEEVGTMNLFVHIGDEIVTPPLGGTILAGITRDSVMRLLAARGLPVTERQITLDEIVEAQKSGALHEIFGTGTAAVVSPVGSLGLGEGNDLTIGDGNVGPLARSLHRDIVAIQRASIDDPFGWTEIVG